MPLVTSPAPQFDSKAVVNGEIVDLQWSQLHDGKWLILFFYPLDFTFVCPVAGPVNPVCTPRTLPFESIKIVVG